MGGYKKETIPGEKREPKHLKGDQPRRDNIQNKEIGSTERETRENDGSQQKNSRKFSHQKIQVSN